MRRRIRLTEGDLRRIVNKSVRRVLRESFEELSNYWCDRICEAIDSGQINQETGQKFLSAIRSDKEMTSLLDSAL